MQAGTLHCRGCNCRTRSVDADPTANNWPFSEHYPDGVPCRYAAIFRCLIGVRFSDYGYGYDYGYDYGYNYIASHVVELKKECLIGNKWVARYATDTFDTFFNAFPSLHDVHPAATQTFPPAHIDEDGYLGHHEGDYRTGTSSCLAPDPTLFNYDFTDHWTLEILSPTEVTLTYTNATVIARTGRAAVPVYRNVHEWDPFAPRPDGPVESARRGNEMVLDTEVNREWPELPHAICVIALDAPGIRNKCGTREQQRQCCDPGTDEARITGNFSACARLSGGDVTWVGNRYRPPASLPAGVSYPSSAPCGVFWGTIGEADEGCTTEEVQWLGWVGLMTWCDGETWAGKAYCFNIGLNEWVEQGDLILSNVECRCGGVYFDAELPPLSCCCDGAPPVETECCAAVPATLTVQVTNHGVMREFTLTYDAGLGQWQGSEGAWLAPGLGAILQKTDSNPFIDACFFTLTCYTPSLGIRTNTVGYYWATEDPAKSTLMTSFGSFLKAATCDPFHLKFEQTATTLFPFNGDCDDTENLESVDIVIEIME